MKYNPDPLGLLKNRVPPGAGIFNLQSVGPGTGGQPDAPATPLRYTASGPNGELVASFENSGVAATDRSTYNTTAFNTLIGATRPGTVTMLVRVRSTEPAGTSGRELLAFGGFAVSTADAGVKPAPTGWFLVSYLFTWLGRAYVFYDGRYAGTLSAGNDYMFGSTDGGFVRFGNNLTGDIAAILLSQDPSRTASLLHESYLRDKYGLQP